MYRSLLTALVVLLLLSGQCSADVFDVSGDGPGDGPGEPEPVPHYEPDSEAMRSVILPGWSQFRQGYDNAGLTYSMIAVISGIFLFGVVELPFFSGNDDNFGQAFAGAIYGLNAVVSGFDAHRRASDSNRENGWDLDQAALAAGPSFRVALVQRRF